MLLRRKRVGQRGKDSPGWGPYLLLSPAALFLVVFIYLPVVLVVVLSFFEWNMVSPQMDFVGFGNFAGLVSSADFLLLLFQSVLYVVWALVGNFLLPVGLALLTQQVGSRSTDLYQSLLFTPTVVAVSVGALLWQWIYLPAGLLNSLLSAVGLEGTNWLGDPGTVLPAVGAVAAWKFLGFNYLISLAGLLAVPKEYLEAARVDGATGWPYLRFVLAPLLAPTLLFLALTTVLQALPNAFVPVHILTRGGPDDASNNLLYAIYQQGFQFFQIGPASATAVLTMALLGGAAVWQFRVLDRSAIYDR